MIGPHPEALWYVHCGNGLLRLWEQQGHPTPATCRCECFHTVWARHVHHAGSELDAKGQSFKIVAGVIIYIM